LRVTKIVKFEVSIIKSFYEIYQLAEKLLVGFQNYLTPN